MYSHIIVPSNVLYVLLNVVRELWTLMISIWRLTESCDSINLVIVSLDIVSLIFCHFWNHCIHPCRLLVYFKFCTLFE